MVVCPEPDSLAKGGTEKLPAEGDVKASVSLRTIPTLSVHHDTSHTLNDDCKVVRNILP